VKGKTADKRKILKCIWGFGDVQFSRIMYFLPGLYYKLLRYRVLISP